MVELVYFEKKWIFWKMAICCRRKKFKVADATYEVKKIKKEKKKRFSKPTFQGMTFSKKASKVTKTVSSEFRIVTFWEKFMYIHVGTWKNQYYNWLMPQKCLWKSRDRKSQNFILTQSVRLPIELRISDLS